MSTAKLHIVNSSNPRKKFVSYVIDELTAFDHKHLSNPDATDRIQVKLFLIDNENRVCGGLFGQIYWEAFQIFTLWVHEEHRGCGYGKDLILEAEKLALESKCKLMLVETASFNGPDFYLKAGFKITGQVENFPENHTFYYFNKRL